MNKKAIRILMLVIGWTFALSACNKTSGNAEPNITTLPNKTTEGSKSIQYQFSVIHSEMGDSGMYVIPNLAEADEKGLYTNEVQYENTELTGKEISVPGTAKTAKYIKSTAKLESNNSGKYGDFYSIFDTYRINREETVDLLHNTNLVVFYSRSLAYHPTDSPISEETAREIAETFIINTIGTESFLKLDFRDVRINALDRYVVTYQRWVNGYATDEMIWVFVAKNGVVVAYNGYNVGKYDAVPYMPTKAEIDAAYEVLNDQVHSLGLSDVNCEETFLITNTAGEVFLEMRFSYSVMIGDSIGTWADAIIVNIT